MNKIADFHEYSVNNLHLENYIEDRSILCNQSTAYHAQFECRLSEPLRCKCVQWLQITVRLSLCASEKKANEAQKHTKNTAHRPAKRRTSIDTVLFGNGVVFFSCCHLPRNCTAFISIYHNILSCAEIFDTRYLTVIIVEPSIGRCYNYLFRFSLNIRRTIVRNACIEFVRQETFIIPLCSE